MVGEDARNRETETSGAVGRPQLTEDGGDSTGVFIRSVFNGVALNFQSGAFMRSASLLSSIPGLIQAFDSGDVKNYYDVIQMSK